MPNTKFQFYTDNKKEFRWKQVAGNNKTVGASSEGFKTKNAVIKNAQNNGYQGEGKKGWIKP